MKRRVLALLVAAAALLAHGEAAAQTLQARLERNPIHDEVFLEVEVTPREVYVQAQLVYVLRIYRAAEFLEAKLSDFEPDGAVTHRLGRDSTYSRTIDGRRYRIIERRFAVFPQASDPLVLPAFRLDARIAEPGAASTMGRLFGEGRQVRIATQPVEGGGEATTRRGCDAMAACHGGHPHRRVAGGVTPGWSRVSR